MAIKTTTTVITLIIPLVRLLQGANNHIHSSPRGKKIIRRLTINAVLWCKGLVWLSTPGAWAVFAVSTHSESYCREGPHARSQLVLLLLW